MVLIWLNYDWKTGVQNKYVYSQYPFMPTYAVQPQTVTLQSSYVNNHMTHDDPAACSIAQTHNILRGNYGTC